MNRSSRCLPSVGLALMLVATTGLSSCASTTFDERARHVLTAFETDLVRARQVVEKLSKQCAAIEGLGQGAQKILAAECDSLSKRIEAAEKERVRLHATPDQKGVEELYTSSMAIYHGISRVQQLRIFAEAAVQKAP